MYESKTFKAALTLLLIVIVLEGDTRRPHLRFEKKSQPRDYRPTKWVPNSAMDIWYGNKSMIDIVSREWADIMNKIILRNVRGIPVRTETQKQYKKLKDDDEEDEEEKDDLDDEEEEFKAR